MGRMGPALFLLVGVGDWRLSAHLSHALSHSNLLRVAITELTSEPSRALLSAAQKEETLPTIGSVEQECTSVRPDEVIFTRRLAGCWLCDARGAFDSHRRLDSGG